MDIAKLILEYLKVLIWPSVAVFLCIYFKSHVEGVFSRLKSAKLPGGISFELENSIKEAAKLAEKVQEETIEKKKEHKNSKPIEYTKANLRLVELGLRPSPSGMDVGYYREIVNDNPNLALAGLRMEVEVLIKNLASGFKLEFDERRYSGGRLLELLLDNHAILDSQYQLAVKVLSLCNKAVHGELITRDQANSILDSVDVLIEDYLAWLSWGFDGDWISEEKG
ncbi:hypothetical protein [Marinomonas sp.]|uniref:hypothetical protein n=1 Tax=Marinomonas sp. TaxID=1904862 RepID=UPI003BAB2497